jgi:hypothetical protein
MRRLIGSTLIVLAAGAGAVAAQEAVLLRVGGTPGQSVKYRSTVETWLLGGPMASMISDTSQPMQQMTLWQTRTLTAAGGDTLTWSEVIDSATAAFPAMPQMAQMASQITDRLRGMTTVSKTDRRGHTYSTQITTGPMAGVGGGGGGNSNRAFYALPEHAVRPGDTWHDSTATGSGDQATYVADYKLERVENRGDGRVAVVSMTGRMTAQNPQATVNMQLTGEYQLDVAAGRILAVTMAMSGNSQTQMGEVPMRMRLSMQAQ